MSSASKVVIKSLANRLGIFTKQRQQLNKLAQGRFEFIKVLTFTLPAGNQNYIGSVVVAKTIEGSNSGTNIGAFGIIYIGHAVKSGDIFTAMRQALKGSQGL